MNKFYTFLLLSLIVISVSVLAYNNLYDITHNGCDWYTTQTVGFLPVQHNSTSLIHAGYNAILVPSVISRAYGDINTTTLNQSNYIQFANLSFYIDSYTATRGISKEFVVWILKADELSYDLVGNFPYTAVGWETVPLTDLNLLEIDKGEYTKFLITTDNPGAGSYRKMDVRAREYFLDTYDMYLNVTYIDGYCNGTIDGLHNSILNKSVYCNETIPHFPIIQEYGNIRFGTGFSLLEVL